MLSLCLLIHYQLNPGVLLQSQHALQLLGCGQDIAHRWALSTLLYTSALYLPISFQICAHIHTKYIQFLAVILKKDSMDFIAKYFYAKK